MSVRFFDGFETEKFVPQKWTVGGYYPKYNVVIDKVHSGVASCQIGKTSTATSYYTTLEKQIDTTNNRMLVGFSIQFSRISANNSPFFYMGRGTGKQLTLQFTGSNVIAKFDETTLSTTSATFAANTQYIFEIEMVAHAVTGKFKLRIDTTNLQMDLTNKNLATQDNIVDQIMFKTGTTDAVDLNLYVDDVYILDDEVGEREQFGIVSILGGRPNELGDHEDFTEYGVGKLDSVKELSGDVSTYVYGVDVGAKQSFQMEDVPSIGNIVALQTHIYNSKGEEFGPTARYKAFLRDATDQEYYENEQESLFDQIASRYVFEKNPFTDTTQDATDINDLEVGVQITYLGE